MAITTKVRKAGDKKSVSLETTIPKEIAGMLEIESEDTLIWYADLEGARFIKYHETKEAP